MALIAQMAGPGNSGFEFKRETVHMSGVARTAGRCYTVDLSEVNSALQFATISALGASVEGGSMHVFAEESEATAANITEMVLAGTVNGTASEAIAVGDPVSINAAGKFRTLVAGDRCSGFALEAAAADNDRLKVAFRGYGTFGLDIA